MVGIRAFWDGEKFFSRIGKELNIPKDFTHLMPKIPIDGEFCMVNGTVKNLTELLQPPQLEQSWSQVRYLILDLPSSTATYEERMASLLHLKFPPQASVVESIKCKGSDHLRNFVDSVLKEGGETILARESKSLYVPGRTPTWLKVKVIRLLI